ncbi:MAG: hypothetical protein ACRCZI_03290 [Cetobacterium sp.]
MNVKKLNDDELILLAKEVSESVQRLKKTNIDIFRNEPDILQAIKSYVDKATLNDIDALIQEYDDTNSYSDNDSSNSTATNTSVNIINSTNKTVITTDLIKTSHLTIRSLPMLSYTFICLLIAYFIYKY